MAKKLTFTIFLLFVLLSSLVGITYFTYPGHFYCFLGDVMCISGDHESAENYFEKSLVIFEEQDPQSPGKEAAQKGISRLGRINRMNAYMDYVNKRGFKKKAFAALEKTIELLEQNQKPDDFEKSIMSELYIDYAIHLQEREQFDRSEFYYNKSLSLIDPDDAEGKALTYNEISYLNFKQKNPKESMEFALKALDHLEAIKDPKTKAAILDSVACAYQLNKDYSNGEKYIKLAIEQVEPYCDLKLKASYYSFLGDLMYAQEKTEEAHQAYEHSSKLLRVLIDKTKDARQAYEHSKLLRVLIDK